MGPSSVRADAFNILYPAIGCDVFFLPSPPPGLKIMQCVKVGQPLPRSHARVLKRVDMHVSIFGSCSILPLHTTVGVGCMLYTVYFILCGTPFGDQNSSIKRYDHCVWRRCFRRDGGLAGRPVQQVSEEPGVYYDALSVRAVTAMDRHFCSW